MGCTRMAGSDYPMDTKFMTVSPDVVFLWAIVVEGETECDGKARFFVVSV